MLGSTFFNDENCNFDHKSHQNTLTRVRIRTNAPKMREKANKDKNKRSSILVGFDKIRGFFRKK